MKACFILFGIVFLVSSAIIASALSVPTYDDLDYFYFRDNFPKGKNKTVVIFGATGKIGSYVIKHCIAQEFNVTAYVRNTSKMSYHHRRLKVVEGKLSDLEKIKETIKGADAIISCLGPLYSHSDISKEVSEGNKNIIEAAKSVNVTRFVNIASTAYAYSKDSNDTIKIRFPRKFTKIVYPNAFEEFNQIAKDTMNSGLNWTTVRYVLPSDIPSKGHVITHYGEIPFHATVSREDIAMFSVCALSTDEFQNDMPILGY